MFVFFFFSSRRRHTRCSRDWSSGVCSSDLSRLGGWLAGALNWHFALMWPLVAFGLLYMGYLAASGEGRSLLFRPSDVPGAIQMMKYYLHLRKDPPPQGKHNPLQKLAYSSVVVL